MTSGTLERPRIACQLGSPDRADIAVRERTAAMMDILFNGVGWTDIALTLNRIAVGMFFMLSGYHKLFNPQRHRALADELKELGVPAVGFNQWWVPTVEFTAGGAVVIGFLAPLAALGLLVITIVAIATSGPQRIKVYKPIDQADRIDDWLYLPEILYAFMLIMVVSAGAGPYSLDALILGLIDNRGG
jgi:putative oxidoreductase